MSSTVTTTTTVALASIGRGPLLGFAAVLALLTLLVIRELAVADDKRWLPLRRHLSVAIAPLLMAFVAIVIGRVVTLF